LRFQPGRSSSSLFLNQHAHSNLSPPIVPIFSHDLQLISRFHRGMRQHSDERMASGIVWNNKIKRCLEHL